MKRELYDMDLTKRLAEKLRSMSSEPPQKKIGTKQDIVKMLIGDIKDLLKRDYSMEQIATEISVDGFDIKAPTLKSYLNRINTEADRKRATTKARERRATKAAAHSQSDTTKKHDLSDNGATEDIAFMAYIQGEGRSHPAGAARYRSLATSSGRQEHNESWTFSRRF